MTVYKWSHVASDNGTADASINYQEGQVPSTLNDSARAAMAALAKFRDDISGATVTDGASTGGNYVVFTYQGFDTLAHMDKQVIGFTPSVTNTGNVALNVDSLGSKPLRSAPNQNIPAGVLIAGTPYAAVYNNSDGAFYLAGYFIQPSLIPLGASVDWWCPSLPNSSFAYANGQPINRTTYATLFSLIGTTYGAGDGLTTFNLPDCRGRTTAGLDNMGGVTSADRLAPGVLAAVRHSLGGAGGENQHALVAAEVPNISTNVGVSGTLSGSTSSVNLPSVNTGTGGGSFLCAGPLSSTTIPVSVSGSLTGTGNSNNTGGIAPTHNNMQPTILCNKIIRIL